MQYKTLNQISISKSALIHNYEYFSKQNLHARVAPVLKSNAYGHGLDLLSSFIDREIKPSFVCVDSLYEAYELYKSGFRGDILIMGYTHPDNYSVWKKLPFIFSVYDTNTLKALSKYQPGARIHIKIETGMNRLGVTKGNLPSFIKALRSYPNLKIEGVFSHLSSADIPKKQTITKSQIESFKTMTTSLELEGFRFIWKHIQATAGATVVHDKYFNLIRLGLGFYGYSPFSAHTKLGIKQRKYLKPALTLESTIADIKNIDKGDRVGYSGTYIAKQSERIAILPIGYNEGIPWGLSNKGAFISNDTLCPVAGRISMNMTTIKLTRNAKSKVGDRVIIIDSDPTSTASLYSQAAKANEIPYTLLTRLHTSIRRILV